MLRTTRLAPLWFTLALAGCGSGSSGNNPADTDAAPTAAATSGLEAGRNVRSLNDTELAQLCDWMAAWLGGYERRIDCDGGAAFVYKRSQEACVRSFKKEETCVATMA